MYNFSVLFIKFTGVGVLNTLFGYGLFASQILLGVSHNLALIFTYIAGAVFNYHTTQSLVFNYKGRSVFYKFVVAYIIIYLFNMLLFNIVNKMTDSPLLSQALILPVIAVFSFILFKLVIFRNSHEKN